NPDAGSSRTGTVLLTERRGITARLLPKGHNGEWMLIIDLELSTEKEPVTFGKNPFGLIGVRMAKTIGVRDGGGTIRNSEGGVDERGVFWKRAKWVDYSGRITGRTIEGITLLDHPSNPNHPTFFHVRDDGWMGASLTFDGPRTVDPNQPLKLRYGLYVHGGLRELTELQNQWEQFAHTRPADLAR